MAIEWFLQGTLIIPMDQTFQDSGMFIAYGLVYDLLAKGIPVKWSIASGKTYNGIDFTATAIDVQTGVPVGTHDYSGGPFIIDASWAAAALLIVNNWIMRFPFPPGTPTAPAIRVHQATAPFSADIAATMTILPRIAVESANPGQIFSYLNAAAIPDEHGNPWNIRSPGVFTAREIGEGALFEPSSGPCKSLKYTVFISNQSNDPRWRAPSPSVTAINEWLSLGGVLAAYSGSLPTFENVGQAGPFLTESGFASFANRGSPGLFVNQPDYPPVQALTPAVAGPETLPPGGVVTWLTSSVVYNPDTRILAYFRRLGQNYDFFIGGSYKNGLGAGKVYYQGGQAYRTSVPYSRNPDGPYLRFIYNVILWSVVKPLIVLKTFPEEVPTTPSTITFVLDNEGGVQALNTLIVVTLAPWAVYNNDATVPPSSVVGQTITWDLGTVATGNILTFTADIIPPGEGVFVVVEYSVRYSDAYSQDYKLTTCTYVEAHEEAVPTYCTELSLYGCLHIPPEKPEVCSIISFDASVSNCEAVLLTTLHGTKTLVSGSLSIVANYITPDPEAPLHSVQFSLPFASLVPCMDMPTSASCSPVVEIEHVRLDLIDPRSIRKDILLFVGINLLR